MKQYCFIFRHHDGGKYCNLPNFNNMWPHHFNLHRKSWLRWYKRKLKEEQGNVLQVFYFRKRPVPIVHGRLQTMDVRQFCLEDPPAPRPYRFADTLLMPLWGIAIPQTSRRACMTQTKNILHRCALQVNGIWWKLTPAFDLGIFSCSNPDTFFSGVIEASWIVSLALLVYIRILPGSG